jgi:hypothetical protein
MKNTITLIKASMSSEVSCYNIYGMQALPNFNKPSSSVCASGRGTNTGSEGEQSVSLQRLVAPFITSTFNIFSTIKKAQ